MEDIFHKYKEEKKQPSILFVFLQSYLSYISKQRPKKLKLK